MCNIVSFAAENEISGIEQDFANNLSKKTTNQNELDGTSSLLTGFESLSLIEERGTASPPWASSRIANESACKQGDDVDRWCGPPTTSSALEVIPTAEMTQMRNSANPFSLFAYPITPSWPYQASPQSKRRTGECNRTLYNPLAPGPFALFGPNDKGMCSTEGLGWGRALSKPGHARSSSHGDAQQRYAAFNCGGPERPGPSQRLATSSLSVCPPNGVVTDKRVRRHSINGLCRAGPANGSQLGGGKQGNDDAKGTSPRSGSERTNGDGESSGDGANEKERSPRGSAAAMGLDGGLANGDVAEDDVPVVKERKRGKRGGKKFRCDRGLRCHSSQCKRTHPPGWWPCPNMVLGGCPDPTCPASCHREMCDKFFSCVRRMCCYNHSWGRPGIAPEMTQSGQPMAGLPLAYHDTAVHIKHQSAHRPLAKGSTSPTLALHLQPCSDDVNIFAQPPTPFTTAPQYLTQRQSRVGSACGFPIIG